MEYCELSNGVKMPLLGFGVFQIPDHTECERILTEALGVGYRLVDTAQAYYNEEAVGKAIKNSGVPRDQIFLTSKVWISNAGDTKAAASIDASLQKLQTDYLDLMLIHQPFGDFYGTYRALEAALKSGKCRAIGVSNFFADRMVDLCQFVEVKPHVNQLETHVFQQQAALRPILAESGTQLQAWGPLAEGKNGLFTDPVLTEIGAKYHKSAAQVALRFLVQSGVSAIPKASSRDHMEQNFAVFDFALSAEDMEQIKKLDTGTSLFVNHSDPNFVKYITSMKA